MTPPRLVPQNPLVPLRCPADSVGTPPNCRCKPGTHGSPGKCVPNVSCPKDRQIPGDGCCPSGTTWNGRICAKPLTLQPLQPLQPLRPLSCPPNSVGTPPNCRCAPGFTGKPPNCVRQLQINPNLILKPFVCPPGTTGTPPNCVTTIK